MSAFIVSTETMQRVVHAWPDNGLLPHRTSCESLDALGARLFAMNARAVSARYGEPEEVPAFRYRPLGAVHPMHQLKAVECLLYQCSEGNVPNEDDFLALEGLAAKLREKIVNALPSYSEAPWNWPEVADDREAGKVAAAQFELATATDKMLADLARAAGSHAAGDGRNGQHTAA